MALFDENVTITPAPRRRFHRGTVAGIWAATAALVGLLVMSLLPSPYVIEQPGPVFDTLGTVTGADGEEVPLISVEGTETYPTAGDLDLLTVQVVGNREWTPKWLELVQAWMDPSRAVLPLEEVFPEGVTTEQRNEESAVMMVDSQKEATAAALMSEGYNVQPRVRVVGIEPGSAADGVLQVDDVIRGANGTDVADTDELRVIIQEGGGDPVALSVERDGELIDIAVTPQLREAGGTTSWVVGVGTTHDYTFPFEVTIQLNDVGGPSAGMMFALGIIDTITEGELNGGEQFAGTGTINASGAVGPIGGIRQKLYGARDAGADYFLAPADNCGEVVGNIPDGLQVFSVITLQDALAVLEAVRTDGDLSALPTCTP